MSYQVELLELDLNWVNLIVLQVWFGYDKSKWVNLGGADLGSLFPIDFLQ